VVVAVAPLSPMSAATWDRARLAGTGLCRRHPVEIPPRDSALLRVQAPDWVGSNGQ